jgi:magnesium transporter
MLTAYLFDERVGEPAADWEGVVSGLSESQVLWLDVESPTEEEERQVRKAFSLGDEDPRRHEVSRTTPELSEQEDYLRVTTVAVRAEADHDDFEPAVLECFVGVNWVVTVHRGELAIIEDFRDLASGSGELGALDAASFLATLLEWVVTSYSRAFAEIERTLEDFDTTVLSSPARDIEAEVTVLVETRQRIGALRRALAPHREIFAALGHAELDRVSTETSARRFEHLAERVDDGLTAARDVKEAVVNSFDMLILRTEHRTNEIVKVLTLTSILLLPGALIAGLMGMNVNLSAAEFVSSGLFWGVIAVMVAVVGGTLALARIRRWI